MQAFLMYKNQDFDTTLKLPWNEESLVQDLELDTLFDAMACGDKVIRDVSKKVILSSLTDADTITYRQNILKDCLKKPSIIREIYTLAAAAIESEKHHYLSLFSRYPAAILNRSIDMMEIFVDTLKKLKHIADVHGDNFYSEGFRTFFHMLKTELSDDYFHTIHQHLTALRFPNGILISAELGKGSKGTHYVLRKAQDKKISWIKHFLSKRVSPYTFCIHERDEAGARALRDLKDRGINLVANALAQSADHILSFFNMLKTELAFYVGCLNLHEQLLLIGAPTSFPVPVSPNENRYTFQGLYDICLSLILKTKVVGNDLYGNNKNLFMITGANQGGKSTFLRSIGLAQLMMQCGMFAAAEAFSSSIFYGIFTHYKREEDAALKSGKLDEELSRMDAIIDHLKPNSLLLFNESFAATNEREGSEVAKQILHALVDTGMVIFFVTHLYELAHGLYKRQMDNNIFLRSERKEDGERTFKITQGKPLPTSFGEDLYYRIFAADS